MVLTPARASSRSLQIRTPFPSASPSALRTIGKLDETELEFEDNAAVCVCIASGGYPVSYKKGFEIKGLDNFKGKDGYYVFHAGTALKDGKIVTNGGRVLGVTAKGATLKEARANAYEAVKLVEFEGMYYRHDIGKAIDEA